MSGGTGCDVPVRSVRGQVRASLFRLASLSGQQPCVRDPILRSGDLLLPRRSLRGYCAARGSGSPGSAGAGPALRAGALRPAFFFVLTAEIYGTFQLMG